MRFASWICLSEGADSQVNLMVSSKLSFLVCGQVTSIGMLRQVAAEKCALLAHSRIELLQGWGSKLSHGPGPRSHLSIAPIRPIAHRLHRNLQALNCKSCLRLTESFCLLLNTQADSSEEFVISAGLGKERYAH